MAPPRTTWKEFLVNDRDHHYLHENKSRVPWTRGYCRATHACPEWSSLCYPHHRNPHEWWCWTQLKWTRTCLPTLLERLSPKSSHWSPYLLLLKWLSNTFCSRKYPWLHYTSVVQKICSPLAMGQKFCNGYLPHCGTNQVGATLVLMSSRTLQPSGSHCCSTFIFGDPSWTPNCPLPSSLPPLRSISGVLIKRQCPDTWCRN